MKNFLLLLTFILAFTSCKNKTLELPQVATPGPSEIQNYSQIWVFYKEKNNEVKAEFNRKNTIGSTHWIINIDKRLPLSEVVPVFHRIKIKRTDKSIHSVEGMNNYLSYSDIKNKKISVFSIDSIEYLRLPKKELTKLKQEEVSDYIMEFSETAIWFNKKRFSPSNWASFSLDTLSKGSIQLHFHEKLSYQDYMNYRLTLTEKLPEEVNIEKTEFVIY